MSRRVRLILALVGLVVVAACTPGSTASREPTRSLDWSAIELPDDLNPSSLAVAAEALLVGGRSTTGGKHPGLATVAADGTVTPLAVKPNSPYAKIAGLSSLATDGRTVYALGEAYGGAHSNVRWTTWQGSTTDGLVEYPQSFSTFGGWGAGGLLDVVQTSDGPAIAGTWSSADGTGLDAAVWRLNGKRWKREDSAGSALANTRDVQVAPRAAAAGNGSTMIISGSLLTFPDGVRQSAAVWTRSDANGSWQLVRLPEPGRTSEALSVACAEDCWIAGHVDGQVALWRLAADGTATRDGGLPAQPVDGDGPGPRAIVAQGRPGVLSSQDGKTTLLLPEERGWTTVAGPDGTVHDAVVLGERLYAVIGEGTHTRLWVATLI